MEVALPAIEPGDMLLFRWRAHLPAKHAAIASGQGRMIHAQEGAAVCEVALSPWWRRHLAYAFRFPPID
jgi:NlpC/P60 family putative phage cell wall peptidase